MVMIGLLVACLSLWFISGPAASWGVETVVVTAAFNEREIKVRSGTMVRVELEQYGSTACRWEARNVDTTHLEVVSAGTQGSPDQPAASMETWVLRAKEKGKKVLEFLGHGLREGKEKTADTFRLTVRIL